MPVCPCLNVNYPYFALGLVLAELPAGSDHDAKLIHKTTDDTRGGLLVSDTSRHNSHNKVLLILEIEYN